MLSRKNILGFTLGLVLSLGLCRFVHEQYTNNDDTMAISTQSFLDSIFWNFHLPAKYIDKQIFAGCDADSTNSLSGTSICHSAGAVLDMYSGSLEAIYFGGAVGITDTNNITKDLDIMVLMTATGTQIIKGDKSLVNSYILTHRDDIVIGITPYSSGKELLTQRKDHQTDIDIEKLKFPGSRIEVPFAGVFLKMREGYTILQQDIIKPGGATGLIQEYQVRDNTCLSDSDCRGAGDSACNVNFYTGGTIIETGFTYSGSIRKQQHINGYLVTIGGTQEVCESLQLLQNTVSDTLGQSGQSIVSDLKIFYNSQEIVTGIVLNDYRQPADDMNPTNTCFSNYGLHRYGNLICLVEKSDMANKLKRTNKVGCIELIDGKSDIVVGQIDTDKDGFAETFSTLKKLPDSRQQYLEYNCEGCAPGPDFGRVKAISTQTIL